MRIIAGQRRGHGLEGPADRRTRPTSDLVRESIFNILGERVVDVVAVDLFAGTGALGLEALSRGAKRAVFVERNRENAAVVKKNIATLRYEDRTSVLVGDAYRWARSLAKSDDQPMVVLIDPPYTHYVEAPQKVRGLLNTLVRRLPVGSVMVVESSKHWDESVLPEAVDWQVRRYGDTHIAVGEVSEEGRAGDAAEDEAESVDEPEPDA